MCCFSACSWTKPPTGVISSQVCRENVCWLRTPVTMKPLCSSWCQPVCPRVLFPSNLHLTFRRTAFLSPFSQLISFEEIICEPQQRLTDSDDMTHTTPEQVLKGRVNRCHRRCRVLGATLAALCSICSKTVCCVVCLQAADRGHRKMAITSKIIIWTLRIQHGVASTHSVWCRYLFRFNKNNNIKN